MTASRDRTAKVWDATTGAEVLTLKGHTGTPSISASFSPDGSRIVTASRRRDGEGLGREDGAEVLTLKGHTGTGRLGVVQPGRVADRHRELRTGRRRSGTRRRVPRSSRSRGTRDASHSASFSPDGSRIVTGSEDRTAKVWDATTGAEVLTLKGHTGRVNSASFSPDGSRIVTASRDGTAKVWDATTGAEVRHPQGAHRHASRSASFSPDGSRVVTASSGPRR